MNRKTRAELASLPGVVRRSGRTTDGERHTELLARIRSGSPLSLSEYARAEELLAALQTPPAQEAAQEGLVLRVRLAGGASANDTRCEPGVSAQP